MHYTIPDQSVTPNTAYTGGPAAAMGAEHGVMYVSTEHKACAV